MNNYIKKIISLILIVMSIFFMNCKVVMAESYAYCYYNYTNSLDKDFKFQKGFNKGNAALIVQIAYNSEKIPNPTISSRFVNAKDVNFTDGYDDEFKLPYSDLNCLSTSTICVNQLGEANINLFDEDGDGKLSCPNLYFLKKNHANKPNYYFTFFSSTSGLGNIDYDEAHTLNPDSQYSKIKNDNTTSPSNPTPGEITTPGNQGILKTCQYKYTNYYYAFAKYSGTLGFSILKDGSVSQIVSSGGLQGSIFKYNGASLNDCPKYLKFTNNAFGGNEITFNEIDANNATATYISEVTGSNSDVLLSYLAYNNPKSPRIVLLKRGNSIYAETRNNANDNNGNVIEVSNINEYLSNFDSNDEDNYPTWINEVINDDGSTSYVFSMSKDEMAKTNYICQAKIFSIYGGGTDEIQNTCESIFGPDFLAFLDSNIFSIVRIAIPVILILLTSFDFFKVIYSDDKDGMQKAWKNCYRRIIVAVLIYLIPMFITFVANIVGASDVKECTEYLENLKNDGSGEVSN